MCTCFRFSKMLPSSTGIEGASSLVSGAVLGTLILIAKKKKGCDRVRPQNLRVQCMLLHSCVCFYSHNISVWWKEWVLLSLFQTGENEDPVRLSDLFKVTTFPNGRTSRKEKVAFAPHFFRCFHIYYFF